MLIHTFCVSTLRRTPSQARGLRDFQAYAMRAALTRRVQGMPAAPAAARYEVARRECAFLAAAGQVPAPGAHADTRRHCRALSITPAVGRPCSSVARARSSSLRTWNPPMMTASENGNRANIEDGSGAGSWRSGGALPRVTFAVRPPPAKRALHNEDAIVAAIRCGPGPRAHGRLPVTESNVPKKSEPGTDPRQTRNVNKLSRGPVVPVCAVKVEARSAAAAAG